MVELCMYLCRNLRKVIDKEAAMSLQHHRKFRWENMQDLLYPVHPETAPIGTQGDFLWSSYYVSLQLTAFGYFIVIGC